MEQAVMMENSRFNSSVLGINKTELWKHSDFADIYEAKDLEKNENGFRVYKDSRDSFKLQIRTHKGIGMYSKGVPRKMIASISLSLQELKDLIKWAENQ